MRAIFRRNSRLLDLVIRWAASALVLLVSTISAAQAQSFSCRGEEPAWTLDLSPEAAVFDLQRRIEFEIPQQSVALGREWPKVFTLVVDFDTAIVVLDRDECALASGVFDYSADILTQRSEIPIVLTGCCLELSE